MKKNKHIKKQVSWDKSVVNHQNINNTFFASLKVPSHKWIKRQIFKRIAENSQKELKQDFKNVGITSEVLSDFFSQEGERLLYVAILLAKDHLLLSYLHKKMSNNIIKTLLQDNNCYILKKFVTAQRGLEELGYYTAEENQDRIEIWTILLQIDKEGIKKFMENSENQSFIPQKVEEEFQIALNKLESAATIDIKDISIKNSKQ